LFNFRTLILLLFLSALGGCATSSLFNPYPSQAHSFKQAIVSNNVASSNGEPSSIMLDVLADLDEKRESDDAMLYMMERGRINQLNGAFSESKRDFEFVIAGFEAQDLAARIEASTSIAKAASLVTNDNAIPYKGAGYERVFTHHHQAFNYLGEQDLEGAAVEFRKLALEQRILLEKYENELAEAYESAVENNIDIEVLSSEFSGLDTIAGKVKNSFQNAYAFYASAAFWEAVGDLNAAWVDYKKAFEINPDSQLLKQDIARVANSLGEVTQNKDTNKAATGQGTVVVFFEEGFVPVKSEIVIPIPTFDGGIISLAFPYYEADTWPDSARLRAVDESFNDLGRSERVVDVSVLAVKDLQELLPQRLVRQVLRGYSKYQLQKQAAHQVGPLGQFLANIYNIVSESADRRSWSTLPHTAQVMRFNLEEGLQSIKFSTRQSQAKILLDIKANRTTFVRIVNVNQQMIKQVYSL